MIKKNKVIKILVLVVWAALFFSTLSLAIGSFGEMEPKAGVIFGSMAGVILMAGLILAFFSFNKSRKKNQAV